MLRIVRHVLYLALACFLQTTWLHYLGIWSVEPDLILLTVVFIALASGHLEATALGFCVGLFQDTYSPADLGLNALTKSLLGFAVGLGRTRIMADTVQVQVLAVMAAVAVHDLVYFVGHGDVALTQVPYYLARYTVGRALYTGLVGAAVAALLALRGQHEVD